MKTIKWFAILGATLLFSTAAQATGTFDQTIKNLNEAYRGESNAHNRYEVFAAKADQEGYPQVAKLFRAAARSESIHRETHKATILALGGKPDDFQLDPVQAGTTRQNLEAAVKGESLERDKMYPEFLAQANEVRAEKAVRSFTFAKSAEAEHAKLYQEALDNLGKTTASVDYYVCTVCGNTVTVLPSKKCPVCRNKTEKFVKIG